MAWYFRALAVNQYRSATFYICTYKNVDYCEQFGKTMGEYYPGIYDIPSDKKWIPLGFLYLYGTIVSVTVLSYIVLEYKRYDGDNNVTQGATVNDMSGQYELATTPKEGRIDETVMDMLPQSRTITPVTVAFKDVWYSVPNASNAEAPIELLKRISGVAIPRTITALMGPSGAGKTTLLEVIAGRKNTGTVRGDILLNGHKISRHTMRRCTGYCEQTDIHSVTATIREALTFSAFLRQSCDVSDSEKIKTVTGVIDLLELHDIADYMVRGRTLEQTKRLTIGVELAEQSSVLFLDEPTSGLDARFAKIIMDGIRKVADSGHTVICTIHQPSYEVFSLFDSLLLLKRGGETAFFGDTGDDCRALVDYFEGIPGVQPLPERYNPATWMLECIGAGVIDNQFQQHEVDFVHYYNASTQKIRLDQMMGTEGVGYPFADSSPLQFSEKRAVPAIVQAKFLLLRFFNMYWRSPAHTITNLGVAICTMLVLRVVSGELSSTSYQGVCSGLGVIFIAFQSQGFVSFNSAIPFAFDDRAAFYREQASQTYSPPWYFAGGTIVEIPYVFFKGLIVSGILLLFTGSTSFANFVQFWLGFSLSILSDVYLGHFLAIAFPSIGMAAPAGSVVSTVFFLFVGFNPPGNAIPDYYQWLYAITPQHYAMSILGALVFGECSTTPELDV